MALTVVWLSIFWGYDRRNVRRLNEKRIHLHWQWSVLRRLAWYALPLGVTMMLASLSNNIPRYFIESFLGTRNLGYFAALSYPMTAGFMVVSAIGQSASPRLAKYYAMGNRRAFQRLIVQFLGLVVVLGVIGVVGVAWLGREILTLLYRSDYANYNGVFIWIAIASSLQFLGFYLRLWNDLRPLF